MKHFITKLNSLMVDERQITVLCSYSCTFLFSADKTEMNVQQSTVYTFVNVYLHNNQTIGRNLLTFLKVGTIELLSTG